MLGTPYCQKATKAMLLGCGELVDLVFVRSGGKGKVISISSANTIVAFKAVEV